MALEGNWGAGGEHLTPAEPPVNRGDRACAKSPPSGDGSYTPPSGDGSYSSFGLDL